MADGHLEDNLRQEIEHYFEGRLSAIKQEISLLNSQFNESLSTLLERQAGVASEGSLTTSIAESLRAAHEQGVDLAAAESARAKASSDMAIIKSAIGEITAQQSQADILKALINRASSFAPRVAFFVIKGSQVSGWRARGFEGTVGDNAIQDISVSVNDDTVLGNVARSLTTWSGGIGSHADDHLILNRFGEEPPQRVVAIPLTVRNRAVAVLYADSAGLDSESINLEALETLVSVAGMAVDLLSVAKAAPKREDRSTSVEAPAYTPEREYGQPAEREPEAMADTLRPSYVEAEPEPAVEEPAAEQASVADEVVHATDENSFGMMPDIQEPSSDAAAPSATRRRYGQDQELPVDVASEDERRLHNDARRFARLLISEIKLYNEQKVAEGRSQGDLYDRLREYIDRSREMYDKRVRAEVAARYDYFHGELVNTLAEGDESKLGSNYPGATVNA